MLTTTTYNEFWRERLGELLPEYRCAQRMYQMASIRKCHLKWSVVHYGKAHLEKRLFQFIDMMGGMAGTW